MATFVQSRFQATRRFFRARLATLPARNPRVFDVFHRFSGFRRGEARDVLKHGITPKVRAAKMAQKYGLTPPSSDEVWLSIVFVGELESLLDDDTVTGVHDRYDVQERAHKLLEAVVLHELVHWCRGKVHGYVMNRAREEAIAQKFEREAYGTLVTAESVGLAQFMPLTAARLPAGAPVDGHPHP